MRSESGSLQKSSKTDKYANAQQIAIERERKRKESDNQYVSIRETAPYIMPRRKDKQLEDAIAQTSNFRTQGARLAPMLILLFVYLVMLMVGLFAYHYLESGHNKWSFQTSFYFSANVFLGVGFDVTMQMSNPTYVFTIIMMIAGSILLCFLLAFALESYLLDMSAQVMSDEDKQVMARVYGNKHPVDEDSEVDVGYLQKCLDYFHFSVHKYTYLTVFLLLLWIALGIAYAIIFEKFGYLQAANFAFGAVYANGLISPRCNLDIDGTCNMQDRGVMVAFYLIVGVPLYIFTLFMIAGAVVKQRLYSMQFLALTKPMSTEDLTLAMALLLPNANAAKIFNFAGTNKAQTKRVLKTKVAKALSLSTSDLIDLSDFVVLELLRLEKIDEVLLKQIIYVFQDIDSSNSGVILKNELSHRGLVKDMPLKSYAQEVRDVERGGEVLGEQTTLIKPELKQEKVYREQPSVSYVTFVVIIGLYCLAITAGMLVYQKLEGSVHFYFLILSFICT